MSVCYQNVALHEFILKMKMTKSWLPIGAYSEPIQELELKRVKLIAKRRICTRRKEMVIFLNNVQKYGYQFL